MPNRLLADLAQHSLPGRLPSVKIGSSARSWPSRTSCRSVGSNGAYARASEASEGVDMYVAEDLEALVGEGKSTSSDSEPRKPLRVPPPRDAPPVALVSQEPEQKGLQGASEAEVKALKAELGITMAELREASMQLAELKQTKRELRSREGEVALLKAALVGRDINLRNSKADLINAQEALREKDDELQVAYQRLMDSAQERGKLRGALTGVSGELVESRNELEAWIQNDTPESREAVKSSSKSRREGEVAELMSDLAKLSQQVADDARQDEETFDLK